MTADRLNWQQFADMLTALGFTGDNLVDDLCLRMVSAAAADPDLTLLIEELVLSDGLLDLLDDTGCDSRPDLSQLLARHDIPWWRAVPALRRMVAAWRIWRQGEVG